MDDPLVLKFHRAAGQRIAAAKVLASAAATLDAVYLGGYGLECSMKAVILASTPAGDRESIFRDEFRGKSAHNIEWLMHAVVRRGTAVPVDLVKRLRRCSTLWYTELRYEPGRRSAAECRFVLESAELVWTWAGRRIR